MKKIKWIFFIAMGATALLTIGNPQAPPMPPTNTELLTDTSWVYESVTTDPQFYDTNTSSYVTDILQLLPTCAEDNYLKFYEDDTYDVNEGSTLCNEEGDQFWNYAWYFDANEDTIVMVQWENDTIVAEILKLVSDTFRFRYDVLDYDSVSHTNTVTCIPRET